MIGATSCAPETLDGTGLFRAFSSGGVERAFVVVDRDLAERDQAFFGPVAGDVARVQYRIGQQRRAYLFSEDLAAGITGG